MADETEIDQMLDEKMRVVDKEKSPEEKKHKKHKKHKHHKSHKKHDRKQSRSPSPVMPSGKRRDVNSELHRLAKEISRHRFTFTRSFIIKSSSTRKVTRSHTGRTRSSNRFL